MTVPEAVPEGHQEGIDRTGGNYRCLVHLPSLRHPYGAARSGRIADREGRAGQVSPARMLLAGHRHAHLAAGVGDELAGKVDGDGMERAGGAGRRLVVGGDGRAPGWRHM